MAIQYFDMGRSMGNALAMAGVYNQMQDRKQMRNFLAENGEALMSGDPAALGQYAQYDPGGALSLRNSMSAERRAQAAESRQKQEFDLRMAEYARNKTAAELAQERDAISTALRVASAATTPEEWDAGVMGLVQRGSIDEEVAQGLLGQFGQKDALIAEFTPMKDWLELNAPKGDDQRSRKITDAQRLYGMDEQTATALVDGFIKVVPDQLGGFNVVDMRKELQPQAEAQPEQPDQGTMPPLSFNLPGVNDSFGIEGFGKGLLNTGADIVGAPVPFADIQDAQSDFGVLREDILSDLANGYRRQPPSWVLEALDQLTPKAGSPLEGSQKAQSKLRALDRKFEREISLAEQQLRRRMKPTDRAEIEGQLTSLRAARSRVQGMLGAFGGGSAGGIPQLFIDSVGDLPEGLTPDDVWAEMSEDEKAAFQQ